MMVRMCVYVCVRECLRVHVCAFAGARAGASTCERECGHVSVSESGRVCLRGRARVHAGGCACMRVLCMYDLPYLTILYDTRWLPGFARVPHYAPSPCHNCHDIK